MEIEQNEDNELVYKGFKIDLIVWKSLLIDLPCLS